MSIGNSQILVLQFTLSLVACALIARLIAGPWLARQPLHRALMILLTPQLFRHIGLGLLV